MAPLLLHLRDELIESHFLPRNLEDIFEEQIQTAYLILNQCYVAMTEGLKILQEFGVSIKDDYMGVLRGGQKGALDSPGWPKCSLTFLEENSMF